MKRYKNVSSGSAFLIIIFDSGPIFILSFEAIQAPSKQVLFTGYQRHFLNAVPEANR